MLKVTLEIKPEPHPRPFLVGDLVEFKGSNPKSVYLLTEADSVRAGRFYWICLHPMLQVGNEADIFSSKNYRLFEGCITLCNKE